MTASSSISSDTGETVELVVMNDVEVKPSDNLVHHNTLSHFQELRERFERQSSLRSPLGQTLGYIDKDLKSKFKNSLVSTTNDIIAINLNINNIDNINPKEKRINDYNNLLKILRKEQNEYIKKATKYKRLANISQYLIGGLGSLTIIAQTVGMSPERVATVQFLSGAMTAAITLSYNYTNISDCKSRFEAMADGNQELINNVLKDLQDGEDIRDCIAKVNIIRKHKLKVEFDIDLATLGASSSCN